MTVGRSGPARRPVALTIAGSDSSGGAGVVADLKTFAAHGCWGAVAVSAVTAQNTLGVQLTEPVTPEMVGAQIASVAADLGVDAAKTGMLATAGVVESVAGAVARFGVSPLVVDPVMVSSRGNALLEPDGVEVLVARLLPLATLVTPNLDEARALLGGRAPSGEGRDAQAEAVAALVESGVPAVLVTGGDLGGDTATDCYWSLDLADAGSDPVWLSSPRVAGPNTHGTGCVLSAAICACLARGMDLLEACRAAKGFVGRAIAAGVLLGEGPGSLDPTAAGPGTGLPDFSR